MPDPSPESLLAARRRGSSFRALATEHGLSLGKVQRLVARAEKRETATADARRLQDNEESRLRRADADRTVAHRPELSRREPALPADPEPLLGHIVSPGDSQGRGVVAKIQYRGERGIAIDEHALVAACSRARRERSFMIQSAPPSALHVRWVLAALSEPADRDLPRFRARSWRGWLVPSPPGAGSGHDFKCPVTTKHGRLWLFTFRLPNEHELSRVITRLEFDSLARQNGAPEFPQEVSEGMRERYANLARGQFQYGYEIPAPARSS